MYTVPRGVCAKLDQVTNSPLKADQVRHGTNREVRHNVHPAGVDLVDGRFYCVLLYRKIHQTVGLKTIPGKNQSTGSFLLLALNRAPNASRSCWSLANLLPKWSRPILRLVAARLSYSAMNLEASSSSLAHLSTQFCQRIKGETHRVYASMSGLRRPTRST